MAAVAGGRRVGGGLGIGFGLGTAVDRLVQYLRKGHREAGGRDNFLALGAARPGLREGRPARGVGLLAAFAAGSALRHVEMRRTGDRPAGTGSGSAGDAVHPDKAEAHMTESVQGFNEQVEKVLEVAAVLVLGALLTTTRPTWAAAGLAATLLLVARPAAVLAGLAGEGMSPVQKGLMGWFGVRGIGSLYYLTYAIGHSLPGVAARTLAELAVWVVALSVVVHGMSVTPSWTGTAPVAGSGDDDRRVARRSFGKDSCGPDAVCGSTLAASSASARFVRNVRVVHLDRHCRGGSANLTGTEVSGGRKGGA